MDNSFIHKPIPCFSILHTEIERGSRQLKSKVYEALNSSGRELFLKEANWWAYFGFVRYM